MIIYIVIYNYKYMNYNYKLYKLYIILYRIYYYNINYEKYYVRFSFL